MRDGTINDGTCGGSGPVGQTFTACQDGLIESLSVTFTTLNCSNSMGTFELYLDSESGPGIPIDLTSPVSSALLPINPTDGTVMVFLISPGFPVRNGKVYRFVILNTGGDMNFAVTLNDYAGGRFLGTNYQYIDAYDLDFGMDITVDPNLPLASCNINCLLPEGDCSCNTTMSTGNTFMSCAPGGISKLTVRHSHAFNSPGAAGTYKLYMAPEPGSGMMIPEMPVSTVVLGSAPDYGQLLTFDIDPAFPVDGVTLYRFMINNTSGASNFSVESPGTYGDGAFVSTAGTYNVNVDLVFEMIVEPPPAFSKEFSDSEVNQFQSTTLTFTIDNTASAADADNLDFTDNLPPGLVVANSPNVSNTCGGTVTANPGSNTISFTGGSVAGGSTCTISVDVRANEQGLFVNTSGNLTSSLGNSGTASATILGIMPIPTLSQWGIMILAIIIIIFGLIIIRQKKPQLDSGNQ